MEARILDAMRARKQEIEALEARCISRVTRVRTALEGYRRTRDPHDFYLFLEDICRLPDIHRVITGGTDDEFDTCAKDVTS